MNNGAIYYDVMNGCISDDVSKLEEYVNGHSFKSTVDTPLADQDEMQGFFFVLTTRCNLSCAYCYSVTQNKPRTMEIDDPVAIIKKYLRGDAKFILINFFGGEPTMEMDTIRATVDYLKTIKDRKVYLRISTNGITSKATLDYLIENRFHITVSSDGVPDEGSSLDKVRNAEIVDDTLRYLVKRKAIFTVRYTATSLNHKNLSQSIKYWHSIGVPLAHIEPYHPVGTSKEEMRLLPMVDEFVNSFMAAIDEAEKVGLLLTTGAYMNLLTPSSYFCTGASGRFCVFNPDGSITTCYRVQSFESKYKEFVIGNWKTDEAAVMWEQNKHVLNKHSIADMKPCGGCVNKYLCSGGCLMRNLTQAGSIDVADKWLCAVKHKLLKDAIRRIWENLSKGIVPVVLGRFILEDYLARHPSMPMLPFIAMARPIIPESSYDRVFDLFECLGIDRKDELMIFNRKIARTECL